MTRDELKDLEQRAVAQPALYVRSLCVEIRRLTAENAELRARPTLGQAIEALENATWYHGESYETARRVIRQLYAEELPHD